MLKQKKAILFDYDGVLVDSEKIHALAWETLLLELLITPKPLEIQKLAGQSPPAILNYFLNDYRPNWKDEGISLRAY